jgi:hypothetical protein
VGVHGGCVEAAVAQQLLDDSQIAQSHRKKGSSNQRQAGIALQGGGAMCAKHVIPLQRTQFRLQAGHEKAPPGSLSKLWTTLGGMIHSSKQKLVPQSRQPNKWRVPLGKSLTGLRTGYLPRHFGQATQTSVRFSPTSSVTQNLAEQFAQ